MQENNIAEIKSLDTRDINWMDRIHLDSFGNSLLESDIKSPYIARGIKDICYIIFTKVCDESEIIYIAVDRVHRRHGYASRLIDDLKGDIFLDVRDKNEGAIEFYRAMGFKEYNRRENYYKDGSTAILMKRSKICIH